MRRIFYGVLTDQAWMNDCLNDLCFQQYAGHLHYNEGRGASHWIIRKQKERCLAFLNLLITHDMSLPRQLRSYLLRQQELYEEKLFTGLHFHTTQRKTLFRSFTSARGEASG